MSLLYQLREILDGFPMKETCPLPIQCIMWYRNQHCNIKLTSPSSPSG